MPHSSQTEPHGCMQIGVKRLRQSPTDQRKTGGSAKKAFGPHPPLFSLAMRILQSSRSQEQQAATHSRNSPGCLAMFSMVLAISSFAPLVQVSRSQTDGSIWLLSWYAVEVLFKVVGGRRQGAARSILLLQLVLNRYMSFFEVALLLFEVAGMRQKEHICEL